MTNSAVGVSINIQGTISLVTVGVRGGGAEQNVVGAPYASPDHPFARFPGRDDCERIQALPALTPLVPHPSPRLRSLFSPFDNGDQLSSAAPICPLYSVVPFSRSRQYKRLVRTQYLSYASSLRKDHQLTLPESSVFSLPVSHVCVIISFSSLSTCVCVSLNTAHSRSRLLFPLLTWMTLPFHSR